jgi:hypothetical protein
VSLELKCVLIVTVGAVLLIGAGIASCNYQAKLDAQAPVVESCIKHPATRAPFRGLQ